MPFPKTSCCIACRFHHFCYSRSFRRQTYSMMHCRNVAPVPSISRRRSAEYPSAHSNPTLLPLPGDKSASRWRTHRRVCIKVSKTNTLVCKAINIGCGNILAAHAPKVTIPHVVYKNKNNVRYVFFEAHARRPIFETSNEQVITRYGIPLRIFIKLHPLCTISNELRSAQMPVSVDLMYQRHYKNEIEN